MMLRIRETLTTDAVRCPYCGSTELAASDSRPIPLPESIHGSPVQMTPCGGAMVCGTHVFLAHGSIWSCDGCDQNSYSIMVRLAKEDDATEDWVNEHLYGVLKTGAGNVHLRTILTSSPLLPSSWMFWVINADGALIEQHSIGPFICDSDILNVDADDYHATETWEAAGDRVVSLWTVFTGIFDTADASCAVGQPVH